MTDELMSHLPDGAEQAPHEAPAAEPTEASTPAGHAADAAAGLFDEAEMSDAPRMPHALKPVVEALIFASPEPITVKAIVKVLEQQPKEDVEAALAELRADYQQSSGLQLVQVAGGYQIVTRPELYEWVRRLFKERTSQKLSVQALETLAVIAYKQPVTAAEISEIRGVTAASGVLSTLLDRKLVKIVGRKQVVGRPFMYGTTREFLDKFGLKDLSDLPKVEDMSEALGFDLPTPVDEAASLPFEAPLPLDGSDEPGEAGEGEPGEVEPPAAADAPDRAEGAADTGDANEADASEDAGERDP
jgi:segregation and condensation protein B